MAEERLDVLVTLRDEASAAAQKIRESMGRLKSEAKTTVITEKENLKSLENVASGIGREIGTTIRMLGVQGAFVSGGFVASLAAMTFALSNFAQSSLKLQYAAQEAELTYTQFVRMTYAMRTKAVGEQEAIASTSALAKSLLNLRRGLQSETRQKLEKSTADGTGAAWADQVHQMIRTEGLPKAMVWVTKDIAKRSRSKNENDRYAAQELGRALGISQAAIDGVADNLEEFSNIVEPDEKKILEFLKATVKLQVSSEEFKNRVSIAFMTTFTSLAKGFSDWLETDSGKAFVKQMTGMLESLEDLDWDNIRQSVTKALAGIGEGFKQFASDVLAAVTQLNQIIQTVDKWRNQNSFDRGRGGVAHKGIGGLGEGGLGGTGIGGTAQKFGTFEEGIPGMPSLDTGEYNTGFDAFARPYKFHPDPNYLGDGPHSTNIEDRRNDSPSKPFSKPLELKRSKQKLSKQTEETTIELRRLVDGLRDLRGGAGGGSSDGGVSGKNRSRPVKTPAGGAGGAPRLDENGLRLPDVPDYMAIAKASDPLAQLGFRDLMFSESKYDQRTGRKLGPSINAVKESEGLMGSATIPMSPGERGNIRYDPNQSGIAATIAHEAGHVGRGVTDVNARYNEPNIFKSYAMQRPINDVAGEEFRQREQDLNTIPRLQNAGLLGKDEAFNETFMTMRHLAPDKDRSEIQRHNLMAQSYASQMMEDQDARGSVDMAQNGWRSQRDKGTLNLDVNVKGPRGTKVDAAVTEGDFIPADQGVTVNREMRD